MTKHKGKPKKAKNRLLALRIKARQMRAQQIEQAAARAINQALSETLLWSTWERGN